MESVEGTALDTFQYPIKKVLEMYVDNVFCIAPRSMVSSLLQHINNIEPSICFTVEHESEGGSLPSLDVLVQRCDDGSVTTSVYRKPTHTDKYLEFTSHHPKEH